MRNITIDVLTFNERLRIGKQGENLTREITFDCAAWLDTLSGGVLSIVHQRPTDSDAYPCGDYTVTDTSLTWSINETDLAFSGLGRCELRYTIGSRIAKSKTFYTEIITALNPLDTPPAAYEPYIDRVIDAARWEMDALSVGGTASETERLSVQIDKIVPVDPDDGYGIYFRFGIPKGADGKGVSNATASVDNNTGTPSVTVTTTDTGEGMDIDFSFHNLKGATGAAGQDGDSVGTVTASVDNNTGTPSVTVTTSGGSGSPVGIDLAFHNLKGQSFDTSFLPSDTASGSSVTFPDGAKNVAVDELVTTIVPQQDLHGYSKPWPAGCGKNKANINGTVLYDTKNPTDSINISAGMVVNGISRTGYLRTSYFSFSVSDGEITFSATQSGYGIGFVFDAVEGTTYTCSSGEGLPKNILFYDSSKKYLSSGTTTTTVALSATAPTGAKYGIFLIVPAQSNVAYTATKIQLEEGSSATTYEPYANVCPISGRTQAQINHNGDTDTIAFGQTVYGGSLNVTTGVLTIDKAFISDLSQLTWTLHDANNIFRSNDVQDIYLPQTAAERNQFFCCSSYFPSVYTSINSTMSDCGMLSYQGRVYIRNKKYSDATTFGNSLSGVQFAYRIANPTVVQLTPTEVDTVLGSNTIYSDCGEVSVKYRADIGLYIDKKLA